MKVGFIFRSEIHAKKFNADKRLLENIIKKLSEKTESSVIKGQLELIDNKLKLDCICSMSRDQSTLSDLSCLQKNGVIVVNDPSAVQKCIDEVALHSILSSHHITIPKSSFYKAAQFNLNDELNSPGILSVWNSHTGLWDKVLFTSSEKELRLHWPMKGTMILEECVPFQELFKVYVIGHDFFIKKLKCSKNITYSIFNQKKDLSEAIETSFKCGEILGLDIYNAEFLVNSGDFIVIDVNDFPSFTGIRNAPWIIAKYLLKKFKA